MGGMKSGVSLAVDQRIIKDVVAQWRQRPRACGKHKKDIFKIFFNPRRKQELLKTFFTKILKVISCKSRHTLL